jgi:hypothetical protein
VGETEFLKMQVSNENKLFGREGDERPTKRGIFRKFLTVIEWLVAGFFILVLVAAYQDRGSTIPKNSQNTNQQVDSKPGKNAALTPAQERGFQMMEGATANLRTCIRSSIPSAYASGVYGKAQFIKFVRNNCYKGFSDRFAASGLGDFETFETIYDAIVEQEIAAGVQK